VKANHRTLHFTNKKNVAKWYLKVSNTCILLPKILADQKSSIKYNLNTKGILLAILGSDLRAHLCLVTTQRLLQGKHCGSSQQKQAKTWVRESYFF